MGQKLTEARQYEEEASSRISAEERPCFHLSPRTGWMNDPNGFSYYKGQYHLFYQYYPYESRWGPMHWGHAVSDDLLRWQYLPAVMAPENEYDSFGCFSGSAITAPDGRQCLMYTGVTNNGFFQTQNIAFGDGLDYEKHPGNPVISEDKLPPESSPHDFRDPKIWQEEDGTYRAVVANDHPGHGGRILMFRSCDLVSWEFDRVLAENENEIGLMWECPDFFELDGKHILLASAQDMLPKGFEYHNGNGSFYLVGHTDETGTFIREADHAADYGIDFYAPQTILTPDGRRVMIGWLQNWDTVSIRSKAVPWFGMMSIPRELSLKDSILFQKPLRELEALREEPVTYQDILIKDTTISLPKIKGRTADIEIEVSPADPENLFRRFSFRFAADDKYHTALSFRPHESTLKIDRKFCGNRRGIINQRRALVRHDRGKLKFRVILDRFSAEVFVSDGEQVMSASFFTPLEADNICFLADGDVKMNITFYPLKTR